MIRIYVETGKFFLNEDHSEKTEIYYGDAHQGNVRR